MVFFGFRIVFFSFLQFKTIRKPEENKRKPEENPKKTRENQRKPKEKKTAAPPKMLRRRRHVQILVFVVKLDFRIRIIKGSLKSILSNRDL